MAFWGVEVKPGKPFHHPLSDDHGKRLHISQATLGVGDSTTRTLLQCNVGGKAPVLLCSLRIDAAESSQLHVEFQESDEVVFSVIGPLSVHLSGYYMQPPGEIEPPGEDIASTDDERSASSSNEEDEYEDSFINDSDPGTVPSSSDSGEAEKYVDRKETKEVKTGCRRLKKKHQSIDSPSKEQRITKALQPLDDCSEDDLPISSFSKCKHEEEGAVIQNEPNKMKLRESGDNSTPKLDVPATEDAEPKRENTTSTKAGNLEKDVPLPQPIEEKKQEKSDRAENVKKSKKKKKKHSGEDKVLETDGLPIESDNVKNLLLETDQGNSKPENDDAENARKSKKKRKRLSGETEGPTIEGESVKNLLPETTNEGDSKTENAEKCKGESVDDKLEKKKRRKKHKSKEETNVKENVVAQRPFSHVLINKL